MGLSKKAKAELATFISHILVNAYAGTGKTFTSISGVVWALAPQLWDEFQDLCGFEITPSDEQQLIWNAMSESRGKVSSIVYCAFNRSIVGEFAESWGMMKDVLIKANIHLNFSTINSLGSKACWQAYGRTSIFKESSDTGCLVGQLLGQVEEMDPWELFKDNPDYFNGVRQITNLCKLTLVGWNAEDGFNPDAISEEDIHQLACYYDIPLNGSIERVTDSVREILRLSLNPKANGNRMDFNDQNWLPIVNNLSVTRTDFGIVDEGQDLPRCKQEFGIKAFRRLAVVGDTHQAIYGFAGADPEAFPHLEELLAQRPSQDRLVPLKLTVTRRCCQAVVREAQAYVPDFKAHPDNPEGLVRSLKYDKLLEELQDGDMLLSRVNAPLVSPALKLLSQGRKVTIRGRDFGEGLINFIKKMKADDVGDLLNKVGDWCEKERQKESKRKSPSEAKLIALDDRQDCIEAFAEGCLELSEVIDKINKVFVGKVCPNCDAYYDEGVERCYKCKTETDPLTNRACGPRLVSPEGVLFSSVHKAKGLEAERVFILKTKDAPMPHPCAKTPWQREQENNLCYVAITRAISELVYVKS